MILELIPYILLFLLTLFVPKIVDKKYYMPFLFLVYFVFSGFRYGVGWDYFNYCENFEQGGWRIEETEFLFRILEYFCINHGFVQLFFVVTSFVLLLSYFWVISKDSINPAVSLFVFLTVAFFFLNSMTTIRFTIAVSLLFLSCHFAYKKQYFLYSLFLLASILSHTAALFGLITIPFVFRKVRFGFIVNLSIFIVCFVIGVVVGSFSFFSDIFNTLMDNSFLNEYIGHAEWYMEDLGSTNLSRTPYIYAVINLINLFTVKRMTKDNEDNMLEHYVTMFNIGCSLMFLFLFNAVFATRLSQFFMVYIILIVPYYKKLSIQQIVFYSIYTFVFFYNLTMKVYHPDFIGRVNCWLPYRMNFSF